MGPPQAGPSRTHLHVKKRESTCSLGLHVPCPQAASAEPASLGPHAGCQHTPVFPLPQTPPRATLWTLVLGDRSWNRVGRGGRGAAPLPAPQPGAANSRVLGYDSIPHTSNPPLSLLMQGLQLDGERVPREARAVKTASGPTSKPEVPPT